MTCWTIWTRPASTPPRTGWSCTSDRAGGWGGTVPATDAAHGQVGPSGGEANREDQRDASAITVLAVVVLLGTCPTDVAHFHRLGNVFSRGMTGHLVLLALARGR